MSAHVNQAGVDGSPAECWVSARLIGAAARFAARQEIRYYLEFIRVEPHPKQGVILIATDGHRMAVIYDEQGRATEPVAIRPTKFASRLNSDDDLVHYYDGKAECGAQGFVSAECFRDGAARVGRFPLWREVLKSRARKQGAVASFNPEYIADCYAVCRAFQQSYGCITVFSDGEKAALVKFSHSVPAFLLLMPVRGDVGPSADLPGFMAPLASSATVTTLQRDRAANGEAQS